ncbi:hypothetical protein CYMTET_14365 [Cymbomonas tetramitiformis]|uniref:Uncharacterized protein n=1 Tax=Cymbomonas tetramitiformis TaxID=36881 RepID=A0AAE0LA88_9CHLO|nr:hypothetical protein CYMTET_14365 [Cymbomonas tetramitiformis]
MLHWHDVEPYLPGHSVSLAKNYDAVISQELCLTHGRENGDAWMLFQDMDEFLFSPAWDSGQARRTSLKQSIMDVVKADTTRGGAESDGKVNTILLPRYHFCTNETVEEQAVSYGMAHNAADIVRTVILSYKHRQEHQQIRDARGQFHGGVILSPVHFNGVMMTHQANDKNYNSLLPAKKTKFILANDTLLRLNHLGYMCAKSWVHEHTKNGFYSFVDKPWTDWLHYAASELTHRP